MTGPVSLDQTNQPPDTSDRLSLDLAVIGLGELNSQHPYFRDQNEFQLKVMTGPIHKLVDGQSKNPGLLNCIAEIVLRLYPVGDKGITEEFIDTIRRTNVTILAVPIEKIRNAGEIMLVAGGRQKLRALCGVLLGNNPEIPIEKTNLTLVTDAWTAEQVLHKANFPRNV
jgi:hypothetical protein